MLVVSPRFGGNRDLQAPTIKMADTRYSTSSSLSDDLEVYGDHNVDHRASLVRNSHSPRHNNREDEETPPIHALHHSGSVQSATLTEPFTYVERMFMAGSSFLVAGLTAAAVGIVLSKAVL